MNVGEVKKEEKKKNDTAKPSLAAKAKDKVSGVNITAAAGTVTQVIGNIALFTGLVGASIFVLAIVLDPMGLWAIPALLAGGYLVGKMGQYLEHKSKQTDQPFSFFGTAVAA